MLLTKLRRIRYSIASTGVRRGLSDVATHFLAYKADQDDSFDRRFGTDTAGSVERAELGIADATVRERAILYLPSPVRVTRWMLANIGVQPRDCTFVDFGCGKGRVLLVAAGYPFQRVVGLEISSELAAIARTNVAKYGLKKCNDIEVLNADATQIDLPETSLLLHFYHPFEPIVTDAVLARLEQSLALKPRKVTVAYLLYTAAVEAVEQVFARYSWLKRTRYEQSVLGNYDWLFYSN
jgi:SAM-dependent methyltransferase